MSRKLYVAAGLAALAIIGSAANAEISYPPYSATGTTLVLAPNDAGDHLCPTGYLSSVRAVAELNAANVPIVFVDRQHKTAALGQPLAGVAGFKMLKPVPLKVIVNMICGN